MNTELQNRDFDKSVACRWSPKLAEAGWSPVSNVFLENYHKLGITANEAMFLLHCFKYKWTVQKPFVSLLKESGYMGKSRDTIQRYARSLEDKGLIKRHYRDGLPSLIDLKPLIEQLEVFIRYPTLSKKAMQNIRRPCAFLHTKEEPLRTTFVRDKSMQNIGKTIATRGEY